MNSLILSRLLNNVHTWVMNPTVLRILNSVYMRDLRRIAGKLRYDATCECSDADVRQMLSQPSLDCLVQRKRLQYLATLSITKPKALLAILQARPQKQQLPWATQMVSDLERFYAGVVEVRSVLPPPAEGNGAIWMEFITAQSDRWHTLTNSLFYTNSCLDKSVGVDNESQLNFQCQICAAPQPAFATAKALAQHQRTKHKMRVNLRWYVDDSGVCPCCKNIYHTRIRVMAHLQNPKKPECKTHVLSGFLNPLSASEVQRLDSLDAAAIRAARKQGHAYPKAACAATDANGKCIGCARA